MAGLERVRPATWLQAIAYGLMAVTGGVLVDFAINASRASRSSGGLASLLQPDPTQLAQDAALGGGHVWLCRRGRAHEA